MELGWIHILAISVAERGSPSLLIPPFLSPLLVFTLLVIPCLPLKGSADFLTRESVHQEYPVGGFSLLEMSALTPLSG